ncbi:MAG: hypothetical protein JNL87_09280 [Burkholderiaceae bacterium]|nr:hypothetical protein [Burkholderiaceae bacterium]
MSRVARPAAPRQPDTNLADDEPAGFKHTLTSVAEAGAHKPAGVPASVFDAGRMARPKRDWTPLTPTVVAIKKGVPLPPRIRGLGDRYGILLGRMEPADCVELTERHAKSMTHRARVLGIPVTTRKLDNGAVGLWRLAPGAGDAS